MNADFSEDLSEEKKRENDKIGLSAIIARSNDLRYHENTTQIVGVKRSREDDQPCSGKKFLKHESSNQDMHDNFFENISEGSLED